MLNVKVQDDRVFVNVLILTLIKMENAVSIMQWLSGDVFLKSTMMFS